MESRRRKLQTRSTDGGRVVGCPKRTVLFAPWKGEGRETDSGGHGRGASEPHGRTDGWTHAHGRLFSDLTNFKDVYAKPAREDGSDEGGERGGGGDRGLGILFLSFRLLSVYCPRPSLPSVCPRTFGFEKQP